MANIEDLLNKGEKGGKNPKKAVALQYEKEKDPAPRVVATGSGYMAEQIIEIARMNNIEIREDSNLVEILSVLEVDSFIPLEAYIAVAEILTYIYRKNSSKRL